MRARTRSLHPEYVHASRDRHGHQRYYFRKRGMPRATLPGIPGSPEFITAYHAARAGVAPGPGASRTIAGSVSAAVVGYYGSKEWAALKPITQATYRRLIEAFREKHGDKPIARIEAKHVHRWMDAKAATPAAANALLKMLRQLLDYSKRRGMCATNAARDVPKLRYKTTGFRDWPDEAISAFEAHWPIGTRQRLAMALLLYTGQRPGDVSRMGRQHVQDGAIRVTQQKTGSPLTIPLDPRLLPALATVPNDQLAFLQTEQGAPFTPAGFSNWFADAARAAGLAGYTAHGLRKSSARHSAESGCTASEILSITGHRSLKQADVYLVEVRQAEMAKSAMDRRVRGRQPSSF